MSANTYGRQVVLPLTNQSGGGVVAGDVVIVDTTNDDAFTTTTSLNFTGTVGIVQETIGAGAVGRILLSGYAPLVNVNASVTRGHYGATYSVAKQATDVGASRGSGTFCKFLTGGATPDAVVYSSDWAASGTVTVSTKGDLQGFSTVPASLSVGTNGQVPIADSTQALGIRWGTPAFIGCRANTSATTSVPVSTQTPVAFGAADSFDTNNFHFTSAANLTGTVTKSSTSTTITGSSTLFTSELSVNQVISIPGGGGTDICVVASITSDTSLTVYHNPGFSASGQTATRNNTAIAIPVAGYYSVVGNMEWGTAITDGICSLLVNSSTPIGWTRETSTNNLAQVTTSGPWYFNVGDYVQMTAYQGSGTQTVGSASNIRTFLTLDFRGS